MKRYAWVLILAGFAMAASLGCGRAYKHPQGIDAQRADDMDSCWAEADKYAEGFRLQLRQDEHDRYFNDCMLLKGYQP